MKTQKTSITSAPIHNAATHFYIAYGLQIQSQIILPWLQQGGKGIDVAIIFGDTPTHLKSPHTPNRRTEIRENEILLIDKRAGRIWIRPNLIVISALSNTNTDILIALMLGSGLAAQLIWRDRFVLHASAIRLPNGNAIAFAGNKKAGKSTVAGFFYHHGHSLVSDDVCPLSIDIHQSAEPSPDDHSKPAVRIQPGFPRIKLDPAILKTIGENPADYPLLPLKASVKHSYPANAGFETDPVNLQAIYLLEEGEIIQITKHTMKDAIFQLMQQYFRPYFLVSNEQQRKALSVCTQIANNVAVFTLSRPKQITYAQDTVQALLANS